MRFDIGAGSLLFGDCLDRMRDIPDGSIDCVVTDPAYRVISGGAKSPASQAGYGWKSSVLAANDGKIFALNSVAIKDYLPILFRVLKPGTHCYVMVNNLNLRELLNVADAVGFGFHNLLRWDKNTVNANRWYMKDCEYTVFLYKKPAKSINFPGSKQGFSVPTIRNKVHPTEKPIELMRHYIENSTQTGEIVFDPFSGSGTTAIAAQQSGRRWIAIEKDLTYYLASAGRIVKAVTQ